MNLTRNFLMTCAIGAALIVVIATTSQASTWTVETDGTGDFEIIQNAVDAAASGDTIRIGTGLFAHKRFLNTPGLTDYVRVHVTQHELTIIGNGPGLTSIGQEEPYELDQGHHMGIVCDRYTGNEILNLSGVRLLNMNIGVFAGMGTSSSLVNCIFQGNRKGADLSADYSSVANCVFLDGPGGGYNLFSYHQIELSITNCNFSFPSSTIANRHVSLEGTQSAIVENCRFESGNEAIASTSPVSQVSNCDFVGQGAYGISGQFGTMQVSDCNFSDQGTAIYQNNDRSVFEVDNCSFTEVSEATFGFWAQDGRGYFANCNLAKGERFVIQGFTGYKSANSNSTDSSNVASHLTFTNNWWGTTDPDSISAWIYDSNDRADSDDYYIDWEPYLTDEVATEKKGFGDLKAMFR